MTVNHLLDGEYIEPYAGGAAIALELLLLEYVSHIHINDISRPIYSFWKSILNSTDDFCRLVKDTPRTIKSWDKQKSIFSNQADYDHLEVGFSAFFLNRTNRSGILNAGIIGGRDQSGPWKIDARYNASELVRRIEQIAKHKKKISVTRKDAMTFLKDGIKKWPSKTLIYCDPPYYVKGNQLYYNFYQHDDHAEVAQFITTEIKRQRWVVSYDFVRPICDLYKNEQRIIYGLGYSARSSRIGCEVMFFHNKLQIPGLVGAIQPVRKNAKAIAVK
jgi:DNA adenine methylase